MTGTPTAAAALAAAMAAYRDALAEVERAAGGAIEARPVFLLDARTLRARAVSDRLAALELARREARADLHRSAEAAALAGVEIGGSTAPGATEGAPAPAPAPARAREQAPPPTPPATPPPAPSPGEGEPWHVRLRLWREAEGLNQRDAAARLGTGKSTWSTWELGTSGPPKPDTIAKLSALTGIPSSVFLEAPRG